VHWHLHLLSTSLFTFLRLNKPTSVIAMAPKCKSGVDENVSKGKKVVMKLTEETGLLDKLQ
jgi:hypothetical protein